jgi:hypothetical protein
VNPVILKLIVLSNGLVQPEFRDSVKVTVERPGVYFVEFKDVKSATCECTAATLGPALSFCETRHYAANQSYIFTQRRHKITEKFDPLSTGFTATCVIKK